MKRLTNTCASRYIEYLITIKETGMQLFEILRISLESERKTQRAMV
jgi:hypothetical protein